MYSKTTSPFARNLTDLYDEKRKNGSEESQEVLANMLGLKRQSVNAWSCGKSKPDIEQLVVIANHFGVTTDWLLGMPNAQRTFGTFGKEKGYIMKATGLSERAAESFITGCLFYKDAIESVLEMDHFAYVADQLQDAIEISKTCLSDSYVTVPSSHKDESINEIASNVKDLLRKSDGKAFTLSGIDIMTYIVSEAINSVKEELSEMLFSKYWNPKTKEPDTDKE